MIFEVELELTRAEQRALDALLESAGKMIERRLPPTLELTGVGIRVARPFVVAPSPGCRGDATEELH